MTDAARSATRLLRIAQLLLVLAALGLWLASRLAWVELVSADGLGQPKTIVLSGATWSSALVPLALLLGAAAVAVLAVRGWPLRLLALLLAVTSAAIGYLVIEHWVAPDVSRRAADRAEIPVLFLVDSHQRYLGSAVTLVAAVMTLVAATLLMRAAAAAPSSSGRYTARSRRRAQAAEHDDDVVAPGGPDGPPAAAAAGPDADQEVSERVLWDAFDDGRDPTDLDPGSPGEAR